MNNPCQKTPCLRTATCEHDWIMASHLLTSVPMRQEMICRKCLARQVIKLGCGGTGEFKQLKARWQANKGESE